MIPHEKLDQIRGRFEFLEARLNAGAAAADLRGAVARVCRAEAGGRGDRRATAALLRERGGGRAAARRSRRCAALAEEELERHRARRCRRPSGRCSWRCCRGTRPTSARRSSRSAPAPAARRRRCSRPTSRGCTSGWPRRAAGAGRWSRRRRPSSAAIASWWRRSSGRGVFAALKFESGVHRVQRVPATESERAHPHLGGDGGGAAGGRGGRHRHPGAGHPHRHHARVGRRRAARQHHRLGGADHAPADRDRGDLARRSRSTRTGRGRCRCCGRGSTTWSGSGATPARAADRKGQVGSGDRSERIRTYNFPQGRLTDHRIGLTLYKLDQVMQGDLDEVIEALTAADQAARLAELDA